MWNLIDKKEIEKECEIINTYVCPYCNFTVLEKETQIQKYNYCPNCGKLVCLKPCPFCGSPAKLVEVLPNRYIIHCSNDNCLISTNTRENKIKLINIWNERNYEKNDK